MTDELASAQVEAFLTILRDRYHLSDSDLHDLVHTLLRLRRRAKYAEQLGEWTAKTVITILITAFFSGIAWAIVHFISEVKK